MKWAMFLIVALAASSILATPPTQPPQVIPPEPGAIEIGPGTMLRPIYENEIRPGMPRPPGFIPNNEGGVRADELFGKSPESPPRVTGYVPVERTTVSTDSLNSTNVLVGPLGRPLGEMLTIVATVGEKQLKGNFEDCVNLTSVNGVILRNPREMPVRLWPWANIKELKPGQQLKLRVYQDGGMMGVPQKAMRESVVVQTQGYAFQTWLMIVNEVQNTKPETER